MIQSALEPAVAFVTQMLMTAARLSHVGDLPGLLTKVPHPVLISGHCLAIAGMTKQSYSGRLMSYVLVCVFGLGATTDARCSLTFLLFNLSRVYCWLSVVIYSQTISWGPKLQVCSSPVTRRCSSGPCHGGW